MTQSKFLDFDLLKNMIAQRKAAGSTLKNSRKIVLKQEYMEGYQLKSDYNNDNSNVVKVRLMPGRVPFNINLFNLASQILQQKYTSPVRLSKEKIDDLQTLLTLLPAAKARYYEDLISSQRFLVATVSDDQEDEEDEENDTVDYHLE